MTPPSVPPAPPPLEPEERARGRRLAITGHPACMTHRMVYTGQLPTLALVSLGASETLVGLQQSFLPFLQLLQLPTLRLVGRVKKRTILVWGHVLAVVAGLPLLAFGPLAAAGPELAIPIILASLAVTGVGIVVSGTVWFPMLRGFVESDRIGRFFGTIRSVWHFTLILYFLGAQWWLATHPGGFALLFGVATAMGVLRFVFISRLPERSERTGERIRIRDAALLLRTDARLRRYLLGISANNALRISVLPFAIVMMRRVIGFSDAEVIATTVATFAGGLVSLYGWGRAVDRIGPVPIFVGTGIGSAILFASLVAIQEPGTVALVGMIAFFFGIAVLGAGFGVADTHVLFGLAPPDAPARLLVVANATTAVVVGIAPVAAGLLIDRLLAGGSDPLSVYHGFFLVAAVLQLGAFLPLLAFRR